MRDWPLLIGPFFCHPFGLPARFGSRPPSKRAAAEAARAASRDRGEPSGPIRNQADRRCDGSRTSRRTVTACCRHEGARLAAQAQSSTSSRGKPRQFGRHIQRQALPEWAGHYINYKSLKKVIKAARTTREPESVQTQRDKFFSSLDAELAKVSTFYVVKQSEARARLAFLRVRMHCRSCQHGSSCLGALQGIKQDGLSGGLASAELRQNLYEALVVFQHELNKLQVCHPRSFQPPCCSPRRLAELCRDQRDRLPQDPQKV